jgi:hypothetical protein
MKIRQATFNDCLYLAGNLREADYLEVEASGYDSALECLLIGLESQDTTYVGCDCDDKPFLICGTREDESGGLVWAMGTDDIMNHKKEFIAISRVWLDKCHEKYDELHNCVHSKNEEHINWLRWLGFSFGQPIKNYKGEEFIPFTHRRSICVGH